MADVREPILARLAVVCEGITGIIAVGRNRLDLPGKRPCIIIQDGAWVVSSRPRTDRFSQVQLMEVRPTVELKVGADAASAGPLISTFTGRIIKAVANDTELRSLVGSNGAVEWEAATMPKPEPESAEPRMDIEFVFTHPFRLADLP